MKSIQEKVKDIVEVRAHKSLKDFAADPSETVAGYYFTDGTAELMAKWLDRRFSDFLDNKRRYADFLDDLLRDPRYLDPRCIREIPSSDQTKEGIYTRLVDLGAAGECYIVSSDYDLDASLLDLQSAVDKIASTSSESLIYCPAARVGYFEGHEKWRYILVPAKP